MSVVKSFPSYFWGDYYRPRVCESRIPHILNLGSIEENPASNAASSCVIRHCVIGRVEHEVLCLETSSLAKATMRNRAYTRFLHVVLTVQTLMLEQGIAKGG